jgi:hypothetical protein
MYLQPDDLYQRVQALKQANVPLEIIDKSLKKNYGITVGQVKVPASLAVSLKAEPQGLAEKIGSKVVGFGKSLVQPTLDYAQTVKEQGGTEEGKKRLRRLQALGPASVFLEPEGRRMAANVASLAVPYGKGASFATKTLLPGAVSGGLFQAAQKEATPESVAGGALLGAGGAALTQGVMGLAGKGLSKISGKMVEGGKKVNYSSRAKQIGVKPPKSLGGVKLFDKMDEVGIAGNSADDIAESAAKILSKNSDELLEGIKASGDQIVSTKPIIDKLKKIIGETPSARARAPYEAVLKEIQKDLGKKSQVPLSQLYKLKQNYGALGKWSLGSAFDKTTAGVYDTVYVAANDLIDKSLQKAGYTAFRGNNKAISTAIKALRYADDASMKVANQPIGLYEIIAGAGGLEAAGPSGAVGAMALGKFARSPTVQRLGGTTLQKAGAFGQKVGAGLEPIIASKISQQVPRVGALTMSGAFGAAPSEQVIPETPAGAYPSGSQSMATPAIPATSTAPGAPKEGDLSPQGQWIFSETAGDWVPNEQSQGGLTKEVLMMAMLQDPKNLNIYKTIAEMSDLSGGATGAKIQNALANVDMMEQLYQPGTDKSLSLGEKTTGIGGVVSKLGRIGQKAFNQDYVNRLTAYKNMTTIALGLINQARGAGVLNAGEFEQLMAAVPNEYTSEQVAQWWFEDIRDVLSRMNSAGVSSGEVTATY